MCIARCFAARRRVLLTGTDLAALVAVGVGALAVGFVVLSAGRRGRRDDRPSP